LIKKWKKKKDEALPTLAGPSPRIYDDAGPSVKSSITYKYTHDRTRGDILPQSGYHFSSTTEFAGLGGDVQFLKQDAALSYFHSLNEKYQTSLGLSLRAGLLRPWSTLNSLLPQNLFRIRPSIPLRPLPICDRYFLDLKGFEPSSVGPREGDDAIGGDLFASLALRLSFLFPFEFSRKNNIFGQVFAVTGNSLMLADSDTRDVRSLGQQLFNTSRCSVGGGIIVPFNRQFKLELTLSKPLRSVNHDPIRHFNLGLNLGVGF